MHGMLFRRLKRSTWFLLANALFGSAALAQSLGLYAMVPVVANEPYIAEHIRKFSPPGTSDNAHVEEIHTIVSRDKLGRLREQTDGTQPDLRGAFRQASVRVLDPVSMLQTDLNISQKTYYQSPIPEQVKSYRRPPYACAGPVSRSTPDGSTTAIRYQELGEATLQGVVAKGCRITAQSSKLGRSYCTEYWYSPKLQINLSFITHYDSGREESDRVVSLRRAGPDEALFLLPAGYIDAAAPTKRTNFNPNLDLLAEYGSIEWHQGSATLEAGGSDAASQVAMTLQYCLGLAVSSERPFQVYSGDLLDTTAPEFAAQHPSSADHVFASKPAKVHVNFDTNADGTASNPAEMLRLVANSLNAQQPYDVEVATLTRPHLVGFALVPHASHDEQGNLIHPRPYLDGPITLSEQRTKIADLATQMSGQLTKETGKTFSCCQSFVAGIPWGMAELQYHASSKPAREVLADLMEAEGRAQAYSAACEARSHQFCFISVATVRTVTNRAGVCRIPGYDPSK